MVATIGLDVELAATPEHVDAGRRDHLAAFLDAVGSFVSDPTATAFAGRPARATCAAEEEYAAGLDLAVPSEADSVKLLTAHRAKGLEWPVVFVPALAVLGVPERPRPREVDDQRRSRCRGRCAATARRCPALVELSNPGLKEFAASCKEVDLLEERRLGYVAFTRAKDILVATGHWWGPTQKKPRGPSPYLERLRTHAEAGDTGRVVAWADPPEPDAENPELADATEAAWPAPPDQAARRIAGWRRPSWSAASQADGPRRRMPRLDLLLDEQATVARWDSELERLVQEARESRDRSGFGRRAADGAVGDPADAAGVGPGRAGRRPRPADAAQAEPGGPVRHPVPRLGGVLLRPAAAAGPGRPARRGGLRHRRRHRTWSS